MDDIVSFKKEMLCHNNQFLYLFLKHTKIQDHTHVAIEKLNILEKLRKGISQCIN